MDAKTTISPVAVALVAGAILAMGCTSENPAYDPGVDLPGECRAGEEVSETFENFERPEKVDLWFLISDAEGMDDYQRSLARAMEPFLLGLADDGLDVNVAVSTTDGTTAPGLAPAGDTGSGCSGNSTQIAHSGDEDWIDTVRCNVQQGEGGDRRQRSLDVAHESLVEEPSSLDDFRRDRARLVTVILSNQDDCSGEGFDDDDDHPARNLCAWQSEELRDVEDWLEAMRETVVAPEGFSVAAIAGPPTEVQYEPEENVLAVCSSTLGSSYPSPRLSQATKLLDSQGLFLSSCVFDLGDHLDEISRQLVRQDSITLCTAEPIAHEPLEVVGIYGDESEDISFGPGFSFAGTTTDCPDGAIRLHREGAESLERLEMTYCAH